MKLIISPIKLNDTGSAVKDLRNSLFSIAMKMSNKVGKLLKDPKFLKKWMIEYNSSSFGEATEEAVKLFQEVHMEVKPTGKVNKATAAAMNELLGIGGQKSGSGGQSSSTAPAPV